MNIFKKRVTTTVDVDSLQERDFEKELSLKNEEKLLAVYEDILHEIEEKEKNKLKNRIKVTPEEFNDSLSFSLRYQPAKIVFYVLAPIISVFIIWNGESFVKLVTNVAETFFSIFT